MKKRTARAIGRTFVRMLIIGAILETVWTIYLGAILPGQYSANHWDVAWVGLDLLQVSLLIGAAWAAWQQRAVLTIFATACATLFVMDAWFDVTTARRGGVYQSVLLAVIVEIPSALIMLWVALRSLYHLPVLPVTNQGTRPTPRATDKLPPIQ